MGRYVCVLLLLGLCVGVPAQASPSDPDAEDWVSIALAPETGVGGFGAAGSREQAIQIGLDECAARSTGRCVTADTTEYGCVAYVWDPVSLAWAGGRGPDKDAALRDAVGKLNVVGAGGGGQCSIPPRR